MVNALDLASCIVAMPYQACLALLALSNACRSLFCGNPANAEGLPAFPGEGHRSQRGDNPVQFFSFRRHGIITEGSGKSGPQNFIRDDVASRL